MKHKKIRQCLKILVASTAPLLVYIVSPAAVLAYSCGPKEPLTQCLQDNPIIKSYLQPIVNYLSAGVGIVVVAMIVVGGIQYSIAGDNPNATAAAKKRIANALLALFAFLLIFTFLQWLIPGGVFR